MYRYIGTGDVFSPGMPVDEDPVAHLERSLYMGEFGYTRPAVSNGIQDGGDDISGSQLSAEGRRACSAAVDDFAGAERGLSPNPYALSLTGILGEPANPDNVPDHANGRFDSGSTHNIPYEQSAGSALHSGDVANVFTAQNTASSIEYLPTDAAPVPHTVTVADGADVVNTIIRTDQ